MVPGNIDEIFSALHPVVGSAFGFLLSDSLCRKVSWTRNLCTYILSSSTSFCFYSVWDRGYRPGCHRFVMISLFTFSLGWKNMDLARTVLYVLLALSFK
jgi:hypothetical protein